jgi:hypothetical protein
MIVVLDQFYVVAKTIVGLNILVSDIADLKCPFATSANLSISENRSLNRSITVQAAISAPAQHARFRVSSLSVCTIGNQEDLVTAQSVEKIDIGAARGIAGRQEPLTALMDIQRRNLDAFMKAQQAMLEGNKAVMEHQIECLRSTMEQVMTAAQGIMGEADVKANFRKRCESMKSSMRGGICNSNILSEVSARHNGKAVQIIQDRIYQAIDEAEAVLEAMYDEYPCAFAGWMPSSHKRKGPAG